MEMLNPSSSDLSVPSWKSKLQIDRVRPRMMEMKSKVQGQLRAKPALIAGIATGLGLALGITGRVVRHRRAAMKRLPTLVVIEGVC